MKTCSMGFGTGDMARILLRLPSATAAVFSLLLFASACGSRGERWERPLEVEGPVVAADRLVFLDQTLARLLVFDGFGESAAFPVASKPHALAAHGDGVLLIGGSANPILQRMELPSGRTSSLRLPEDFSRIALSPDGTRAILTFDPGSLAQNPVRNLNEIAVVDFAARTATSVTLRTGSLAPRQVIFAPGGELAAILLDETVALVELVPPLRHLQIPLGGQGGTRLQPVKATFSQRGERLFVQTRESTEVLAVDVIRAATAFDATVNFLFLPGAAALHDIIVPEGLDDSVVALWEGEAGLLAGSGDVSLTRATTVPPGARRIIDMGSGMLFFHGVPGEPPDMSSSIAAWEPLADRNGSDSLPGRLLAPPQFAGDTIFLPHLASGGQGALTVVTVDREGVRLRLRQQPLAVSGRPVATAVDELGRFYAALQQERMDDDALHPFTGAVVGVDPVSLQAEGAVLDEEIIDFGVFGPTVFALHPAELGDMTLLPRTALRRSHAIRVDGFLASEMMNGRGSK